MYIFQHTLIFSVLFQSAAITGENIICRRLSWWSQQHNIRCSFLTSTVSLKGYSFLMSNIQCLLSGSCQIFLAIVFCFPMVHQGSFHCQMKQASWINPLVTLYMKMRDCFVLSVSATGSEVFQHGNNRAQVSQSVILFDETGSTMLDTIKMVSIFLQCTGLHHRTGHCNQGQSKLVMHSFSLLGKRLFSPIKPACLHNHATGVWSPLSIL